MISIIIICKQERCLNKTLENLLATTIGDFEIIVSLDGTIQDTVKDNRIKVLYNPNTRGRRVCINKAVEFAQGDYFFHTDAHCFMRTDNWNIKLMETCNKFSNSTVVSCILNVRAWKKHLIRHVYHHWDSLSNSYWVDRAPVKIEEELMTMTGCAWLHKRDQWEDFNETYSGWGYMGIEWTLRKWLCGIDPRPIILRNDVICEHIGRVHKGSIDRTEWAGKVLSPKHTLGAIKHLYEERLAPNQHRDYAWLADKFNTCPGWDQWIEREKDEREERKVNNLLY